jgi:hypothetical protein
MFEQCDLVKEIAFESRGDITDLNISRLSGCRTAFTTVLEFHQLPGSKGGRPVHLTEVVDEVLFADVCFYNMELKREGRAWRGPKLTFSKLDCPSFAQVYRECVKPRKGLVLPKSCRVV